MRKRLLGEILLDQRLIMPEDLESCLQEQRATRAPLGSVVVRRGLLSTEKMLQVLAAQKGVSPWFLHKDPPSDEALAALPPELCQRYQALPVAVRNKTLVVAMRNPSDIDAIDALRNITEMRIEPALADEGALARAIEALLTRGLIPQSDASRKADGFVDLAMSELAKRGKVRGSADAPMTEVETRPVVGLINEIIANAVRMRATDIHIEPREDRVDVRYRIDGQLAHAMQIPFDLMAMVVARIKIMAEVDVVEYRLPQDGRMQFTLDGRALDLRLSVLPNHHGQRIVLRILDRNVGLRSLDELAFSERNLDLFRRMIERPYGLVLVTGPTGSGKTTTLYSALSELRKVTTNIMTCEDPVEYAIDGINQSQVREKIGLTFAAQLRAILRQDPDVVLVGEIRDQETAETAIRASLTGHLVLSTLHCNDAASAVPRLLDMGVDPFMLSTSLVGVVAQRLLRTLCFNCREERKPDVATEMAMHFFGLDEESRVWMPKGCPQCQDGFKGRMAVHEVLPVSSEVAPLIAGRASTAEICEVARRYGYRTMQEDAIDRVHAGLTSFVEAKRLIAFDNFRPLEPGEDTVLRLAS